jgi:hypothetical protein
MYTHKRSAAELSHEATKFAEAGILSVTKDASSPEEVDKYVSDALPKVKRLCAFLETNIETLEEWQHMRVLDGVFHCEKCHEVKSSTKLMFPIAQQWTGLHYCKQWPRWCQDCVAASLPGQCPGEDCYAEVRWSGGSDFFVHVEVHEVVNKRKESVVAQFGLFLDPAVATLRTIKQAVLDKTEVPIKNQSSKLIGLDKTLTELGVEKASKIVVTYKRK